MPYRVVWTKRAVEEPGSMGRRQAMIIASWVSENLEGCENPTRVGNCAKLEGVKDGWRWRVGKHRILGRALGDKLVVDVFRVGNRRDARSGPPK